eukprot:CAMPEP_0177617334 /NCGR_PEP_ID=MMETSP0419_2-20121207/24801_1 /TAXON_ID=582737 /ORGANISM="Tetraselmis sp., Strain GSL018" /LENGTH=48 /DNA_ID= /DNA_START= /DNA_END= /DNA_ORIENTATION=
MEEGEAHQQGDDESEDEFSSDHISCIGAGLESLLQIPGLEAPERLKSL